MIYKMTLTDSSDTMTFNLLETPIVDKDIEGAVDNVTLDGNQYTDYLYLKKQYIQKWAIMCPDEYDELRGFYTRQFEEGEIPSYRVYYGANVAKDYTYNGDYFQFNAKGIETGMYLSQLTGNATQDGTPTPDSPVPIDVVTGEQTVKVEGKNLFDKDNATVINAYITVAGALGASGLDRTLLIPIRPSTTYTISAERVGQVSGQPSDDFAGTLISSSTTPTIGSSGTRIFGGVGYYDSINFTFTTDSTQNWLALKISNINRSDYDGTLATVQLELGSTATTYEPYQGQSYTIDLDTLELAKIGTYQDRIYKEDGKWYIEKQVGKHLLKRTDSWTPGSSNTYYCVAITDYATSGNIPLYAGLTGRTNVAGIIAAQNMPDNSCAFISQSGETTPRFYVKSTSWSAYSDLATWLDNNPNYVYYALATPTTTEITDETLLSQLNFIASLYEGVNNISIVGTGAQGEMEVLIRDVLDVETDVVPETPVRLTLTDGGVINACGCRRDVELTMRETTE